jgi:hypothetical protein
MDSTYKTNIYQDWVLTTIMVRDENVVWIPACHFYVSRENNVTAAAGLMQIKQLAKNWKPK